MSDTAGPIGFFDSGLGGLTVLQSVREMIPDRAAVYLGDNARAPYGELDHRTIFRHTLEGVRFLCGLGCPLIIIACNTASAQALRRIQREVLPSEFPDKRVLGVIRPSAEAVAGLSAGGRIGVLATPATASSGAYRREICAVRPEAKVTEIGLPALVTLVESGMAEGPEADQAVREAAGLMFLADPEIDTVLLGCTHFPLAAGLFEKALPRGVRLVVQGPIVAEALLGYLSRHPEIDRLISRSGGRRYLCTGDPERVSGLAARFTDDHPKFEFTSLVSTPHSLPPTT